MRITTVMGRRTSSAMIVGALALTGFGATSIATADGAHAAGCVHSQRVKIKEGKRGIDSVKEAQCRLNDLGYGLKVDGVFGPSTTTATKDFQSKNGLAADGVIGPSTWAKLIAATGGDGDTGSRDQKVNTVIDFARGQVGETYVLGATGPSTWDCSGLTQKAFAQVGITLKRKSTDQHTDFAEVSAGDRKPGDLIWWTGKTHVALYVGNNTLIDASSSKGKVTERAVYSYDGKPARYYRVIP